MLQNLEVGEVTVPLRHSNDQERINRTQVARIIAPESQFGWFKQSFRSQAGAEPAMISFSSGTEGPPKAVLLTRTNLHDVVQRITSAMEITSEIREYVGIPVYHSFGYGRCRAVLNAGGELWLPENGFDLAELRRMLISGEINAISAVPSQWRILLQNRDLFAKELSTVRWAEIGSQHMAAEEKLLLRQIMPEARIVQHYGLTEASRATLLRVHDAEPEMLGSVGCAEGATAVRINERGRIEVRGPNVALSVDDGTDIRKLSNDDWFETNDLGRIENDALYFIGRDDDVINCAGIKLSPDLMEAEVRKFIPNLPEFAILRVPDSLRGDGIMIALGQLALPHKDQVLTAVRSYARNLGCDPAGSLRVAVVDNFTRTSTGKLKRRALAERIAEMESLANTVPERIDNFSEGGSYLAELLETQLGKGASGWDTSFFESGADSLAHMQVLLALERIFGKAPENWEYTPLADLVTLAQISPNLDARLQEGGGAPELPRGDKNMNPKELSFWALVHEDFRTNGSSLTHQGFLMLFVHRFGNWRMGIHIKLLRAPFSVIYKVLNKFAQILCGMKLDYTVEVGRRVKLEHFGGMILGARKIGDDVILRQNTTLGIRSLADLNAKPIIGNSVDVGAGAVIVGNITVGDHSIIGANSVVFTNVPAGSIVVGVPGKIIARNIHYGSSQVIRKSGGQPDQDGGK
jgi:serine acetyltransferase/acyl-coenzyme A synthetase/AMP-(fatty) acid ligase/acyl carrier protein